MLSFGFQVGFITNIIAVLFIVYVCLAPRVACSVFDQAFNKYYDIYEYDTYIQTIHASTIIMVSSFILTPVVTLS